MPIILNEEEALKKVLQGITVSDYNNATRPVLVRYGQPDQENHSQTYPYIILDLVDITVDNDRIASGIVSLPYIPEGWPTPATGKSYWIETPLPLSFYYQATLYSRHPKHDREMLAQLMHKIPYKYGGLYVPEDDTIRSCWLVQFRKQDNTEGGKRLFRSTYTIRVFSEMLPMMAVIVGQANSVVVTMPDIVLDTSVPQL